MNDSDRLILEQILVYCEKIQNRINQFGITEESFIADDALTDMLLMPVFQIGELANSLSRAYVDSCTSIPWHAIRGFRNIIAHDYGVVDSLWAWNTISADIPYLKSVLMEELK